MEQPEPPYHVEESDPASSNASGASGKVRAVVGFIAEDIIGQQDSDIGNPQKVIIFSQLTRLLNLLGAELQKRIFPSPLWMAA